MMLEEGVLLSRVSSSAKNLGLKGDAYVACQVPGDVFSESVLTLPDFLMKIEMLVN